jgi:Metal-dependent hydrolases of the beta-lactamase superfamily III
LGQIPATGYRVSFENESIALSGDTGFCDSLIKLVKGTDLAILDATFKGKVTDEVISKVHLSEKKAKEVGKLAKEFILIHGIEHPKF